MVSKLLVSLGDNNMLILIFYILSVIYDFMLFLTTFSMQVLLKRIYSLHTGTTSLVLDHLPSPRPSTSKIAQDSIYELKFPITFSKAIHSFPRTESSEILISCYSAAQFLHYASEHRMNQFIKAHYQRCR